MHCCGPRRPHLLLDNNDAAVGTWPPRRHEILNGDPCDDGIANRLGKNLVGFVEAQMQRACGRAAGMNLGHFKERSITRSQVRTATGSKCDGTKVQELSKCDGTKVQELDEELLG